MRREGSPWQGLGVVMLKELSDHLASARMRVTIASACGRPSVVHGASATTTLGECD